MSESRLRVAVIGSGISGVATAWFLHRDHEVTVFEASSRLGGHTRTVDVATGHGDTVAVDTGFIVFNDRTYPNFTKLLGQLGVPWRDSEMSFSVRDGAGNREWNGRDLRRVFGQRRNLLRPSHWRMVRDILRWNRLALALVESGDGVTETLGEFMVRHRFSAVFKAQYLVPMAAAIWSAPPNVLLDYPAGFIARFFANHGMRSLRDRPTWRTVVGGSRSYLDAFERQFSGTIRRSTPVRRVSRKDSIEVETSAGPESFDAVVFATHSDQALAILSEPTPVERDILTAVGWQPNEVVLHTDCKMMPQRKSLWAAWNVHQDQPGARLMMTYDMNILQGLTTAEEFLVSLNSESRIDGSTVRDRVVLEHPVYRGAASLLWHRHGEISGVHGARGLHFAGAWWRNGFHEDGVASAVLVAEAFGISA